ncbi:MAG: hypothetical protein KKC80_06510 [Candidatus Margulisbacteria bacterium]|nr:hypothetical protein [Candidatus Margulisiibacteriota bacterium]MBU1617000.1 hypothetical protein [Candidatus Margulisiibacteriota bacterium]
MSIKRVEAGKTGKAGRAAPSTPPAGLPPILRASWEFLKNTAKRFAREGREEKSAAREEQYIKEVVKKFR